MVPILKPLVRFASHSKLNEITVWFGIILVGVILLTEFLTSLPGILRNLDDWRIVLRQYLGYIKTTDTLVVAHFISTTTNRNCSGIILNRLTGKGPGWVKLEMGKSNTISAKLVKVPWSLAKKLVIKFPDCSLQVQDTEKDYPSAVALENVSTISLRCLWNLQAILDGPYQLQLWAYTRMISLPQDMWLPLGEPFYSLDMYDQTKTPNEDDTEKVPIVINQFI